jgi:hypothetical protein
VVARLINPSSEWYVHREWYRQTALGDLLKLPGEVVPKNSLYHLSGDGSKCTTRGHFKLYHPTDDWS